MDKKYRIEEILVSNSSLVSGLSEASGVEFSWVEVSHKVCFVLEKHENNSLLKAYWRPLFFVRALTCLGFSRSILSTFLGTSRPHNWRPESSPGVLLKTEYATILCLSWVLRRAHEVEWEQSYEALKFGPLLGSFEYHLDLTSRWILALSGAFECCLLGGSFGVPMFLTDGYILATEPSLSPKGEP